MDMIKLEILLFFGVITFFTPCKAVTAFPPQCHREGDAQFICNKGGLRQIPSDIPKSASYIDLSNNIMLKFKEDYFVKFQSLQLLYLNNCRLKHAVLLPKSLRVIQLNHNALSEEAIRKTFARNHLNLTDIQLASNGLILERILKLIPRNIEHLNLAGNILPEIRQDYFHGLDQLSFLQLNDCEVKEVRPRSLESLTRLENLQLENNSLVNLPEDLFSKMKKLTTLSLKSNKFIFVPKMKSLVRLQELNLDSNKIMNIYKNDFHMKSITFVNLARNRIESFDLRGLKTLSLDLSFNKIKRLDSFAFRGFKRILQLKLQNNSISYVSPLAFRGVTHIGSLYLHKNAIDMLPTDVFRNMSISSLFLYGNKIKTTNGVLKQMTRPPLKLLLFSNPGLDVFNASEFSKMTRSSEVVITCNNLRRISGQFGSRVNVQCFPPGNFSLLTTDSDMESDGFRCPYYTQKRIRNCFPCPLGTFISSTPCQNCPPGSFYQDEFGLDYCKTCPLGQYVPPDRSPGKSPLDCVTCPDGTEKSLLAGYRACSCIDGFARRDRFGKCTKCTETGIACKHDYPMLKQGYWWTWHHGSPSDLRCKQSFNDFINNLKIADDSYVRKSSTFNCKVPQPHKCPVRSACLGGVNSACLPNYGGVLCSSCAAGYSRDWQRCIKCPIPLKAGFQFVGYIALFCIVCALISLADKVQLSGEDGLRRTFADVILSNLKILLGFYQVLAATIQAFSFISWPNSLKKAIGTFQFVQLQVFRVPSLSCINPDWGLNAIHEFWVALVGTAAVPVIILAYYIIRKACLKRSLAWHPDFMRESAKCKKNCQRVLLLFLFVTYPLTSQKVVQILPISCHEICTAIEKGICLHQISYLRADYSVECLSTNDLTLVFAYAGIIILIGFPVIVFFLLLIYASKSRETCDRQQENHLFATNPIVHENSLQFAIKFLHENYTPENYYWEALEMLRKIVMTAGVTLFIGYYKMGIGITIAVAGGFAIAHAYRRPMQNKFENMVQLFSVSIIPINLCLGVVLKWNQNIEDGESKDDHENIKLGIFLVSLNLIVFLLIVCRVLKDLARVIQRCGSALHGKVCCLLLPCSCPCRQESNSSEDGYIECE